MTPELNGYNLDKDLFTRWEAWEPHTKTRSYIRTLLRCRWIPKTRFPVQAHRHLSPRTQKIRVWGTTGLLKDRFCFQLDSFNGKDLIRGNIQVESFGILNIVKSVSGFKTFDRRPDICNCPEYCHANHLRATRRGCLRCRCVFGCVGGPASFKLALRRKLIWLILINNVQKAPRIWGECVFALLQIVNVKIVL